MAMIYCEECGQEISDKAKKCIHCGKVFIEEEDTVIVEVKCSECDTLLSQTDEACPNCGCPVKKVADTSIAKPSEAQISSAKISNKTKIIVVGVFIALIMCIVGGRIGYKSYSDKKAEEAYQLAYNTYIENLEKAQELMLEGGSDAQQLCDLASRVWLNAIYEREDDDTDRFTKPNGYFVSDFNTALANFYGHTVVKDTISRVEDNQSTVKRVMKELQDVPEGLDKCYDTVSDLNVAYATLLDLAVNPSGNYSGYTTNKNNAISDFMSVYEKLDTQIPDKK